MRVAVVRFQIKAEAVAAFRDALVRHATTSLAREPGCVQLDFAADLTSPVHFLTYEVFVDETAFKAHLESAQWLSFVPPLTIWFSDAASKAISLCPATPVIRSFEFHWVQGVFVS